MRLQGSCHRHHLEPRPRRDGKRGRNGTNARARARHPRISSPGMACRVCSPASEVNTCRAFAFRRHEMRWLGRDGDVWYRSGSRLAPSEALCGPVAQLAEQQTLNLRVEGSIPSRLTTTLPQFHNDLRKAPGLTANGNRPPRSTWASRCPEAQPLKTTSAGRDVTAGWISCGTSIPWASVPSMTSCRPSLRLSVPTRA